MSRSQTLSGKPFYYQGNLVDGLTVSTADDHGRPKRNVKIPIQPPTIISSRIGSDKQGTSPWGLAETIPHLVH